MPTPQSHVGPFGASIFASALERVALINNMPLGWLPAASRSRGACCFRWSA
jgi:hypothetical protein